jgi:hypothetical protein
VTTDYHQGFVVGLAVGVSVASLTISALLWWFA